MHCLDGRNIGSEHKGLRLDSPLLQEVGIYGFQKELHLACFLFEFMFILDIKACFQYLSIDSIINGGINLTRPTLFNEKSFLRVKRSQICLHHTSTLF